MILFTRKSTNDKRLKQLSRHQCRVQSGLRKHPILAAVCILILSSAYSHANDSTGYIGTGGVEYIKNQNISMQSEDLYISKELIKVDYKFANLTNRDITETVLFPLPAFAKPFDVDFAYTDELIRSFRIFADNQYIVPDLNIRTYMPVKTLTKGELGHQGDEMVDATQLFEDCGLTESEMMGDWNADRNGSAYKKLFNCDHIALKAMQDLHRNQIESKGYSDFEYGIYWESQPIYSWDQTFKANSTIHVRHSYKPLVGFNMNFDEDHYQTFCAGDTVNVSHEKLNIHSAIEYILTTGANWATPIKEFTLTVERDPNEIMSFCWEGEGEIRKIGPTTFQIKEYNFIPTHDFHVAFII